MVGKKEDSKQALEKLLLQELRKSAEKFMSAPFSYSYFISQQIEEGFREILEKSEERQSSFTKIYVDWSGRDFFKCNYAPSLFSMFEEYDRKEEDQWEAEGFSLDELNRQRLTYLYGNRWSDEGIEGAEYDRGFIVSLIIGLSLQLTEKIAELAELKEIPLYTVISIFYGILDVSHNNVEVMVNDKFNHSDLNVKYKKISSEINEIIVEFFSLISISFCIELLWILSLTDDDNKLLNIKKFIKANSFHLTQENEIFELTNKDLIIFLKKRYSLFNNSYMLFILYIEELTNYYSGISIIKIKKYKNFNIESLENYSEHYNKSLLSLNNTINKYIGDKYNTCEHFELGNIFSIKLSKKLLFFTYKLRCSPEGIIKYISRIVRNIAVNITDKYIALENEMKSSRKTINRYKNEYGKKLSAGEIYQIKTLKEKNMKHARDDHFTQNRLIKDVFMDYNSVWYNDLVGQGINVPDLSRKGFLERLKKLEKKGELVPDATSDDGKVKYYSSNIKRLREIGRLVELMGRKKKQ